MRNFLKAAAVLAVVADFLTPSLGLVQAQAQSAPSAFGDNILINPWMEIDQVNEGTAATFTRTAAGTFTYKKMGDGWQGTNASSTSGSPTVTYQNAAIAPNGSISDLLFTQNATVSATHADGTLVTIEQRVEPPRIAALQYGTANAQGSYLSFCAKSSVAGTYGFYIAGGASARTSDVAAGAGASDGSTYFHAFSIPAAAQWSCYQFYIPGDTGGTWLATTTTVDATHGATLGFVLAINGVTTTAYGVPTASAADGVWFNTASGQGVIGNNSTYAKLDTVANATFELTGVKWSLSPTPLPHNPGLELLEAQRYYAKTFATGTGGSSGVAPAQNHGLGSENYATSHVDATSTAGGISWFYPTVMRAAPVLTTYDPSAADSKCVDLAHTATTQTATIEPNTTSNQTSAISAYIGCAAGIANTAGDQIAVGITADARL